MPSSTGSNITPNNMAFLNEYLKNLNKERLAVKNTRVSRLLQEAAKPKNTRNVINAIAMRAMFKEPKGYFKRRAPTRKTYGPRKPRSNKGKKRGPRSHKLANVNFGNNNNNLNKGSVLNGLSKRTF